MNNSKKKEKLVSKSKIMYWSKIENSKILNASFKNILINLLLIVVNVLIALAIQFKDKRTILIIFSIITFILYILIVIFYGKYESYEKVKIGMMEIELEKRDKKLAITEKQLKVSHEALIYTQSISQFFARNINILKHDIIKKRESDDTVWDYKHICFLVCKFTYDLLVKLYNDDDNFEVSYISYKQNKNANTVACMVAYETRNEKPSIYGKEISLIKKPTKKQLNDRYFFEKIYSEHSNSPKFILNEEKIIQEFKFPSANDECECKYKQYIGIPICCDANIMIGLLQIVTFKEEIFPNDEEQIKKTLLPLLRTLAYLTLLANKTQSCLDALLEVNQNEK